MPYYLSWQYILPLCSVAAALLLSILLHRSLTRKIVRMSNYYKALTAASPARYKPTPISSAISGRSPGISTRRNPSTPLPDYPRHRDWKSKGARYRSKWRTKQMFRAKLLTLYLIMLKKSAVQTAPANRPMTSKQNQEPASSEVSLPVSS